ncbi:MAG: hypothetical protein AAF871_09240 [Pseudomonadota bacterium]
MLEPRTAFIHIGLPKTGSTAIQSACAAGRPALAASGIHFPDRVENHSEWLSLAFWEEDAHFLSGLRWQDGGAAEAHRAAQRESLEREISAAPKHLLLSGEGLSVFRASEATALRDALSPHFDRLRVIAYLREPLSWATSATQQAVKWSGDTIEARFERPRLPEFAKRLDPWLRAFGPANVDMRAFVKDDIVADFSRAIGLSTPLKSDHRVNEAMNDSTLLVLSHANRIRPPFIEARHNPFRSFCFTKAARLPGQRFTLPVGTVEKWRGELARERSWANEALGRTKFRDPGLPKTSRATWAADARPEIEEFAETLLEKCRAAQNEKALRLLFLAQRYREGATRARDLLDQAWLLTTYRWTLDAIAHEALGQDRADRTKFFAKGRLMRRIETPEPGEPPLKIGNPFDRPWRAAETSPECVRSAGRPAMT